MAVALPNKLGSNELKVLREFSADFESGRTISDLAVSTRQSPGEVMQEVDNLVRHGALRRDGDRIRLTSDGHLLQCLLDPAYSQLDNDRLGGGCSRFGLRARPTTMLLINLMVGVGLWLFVSIYFWVAVLRPTFGWVEAAVLILLPFWVGFLGIRKVLALQTDLTKLNRFKMKMEASAIKVTSPDLKAAESTDVANIDRISDEAIQGENPPPNSAPQG